MMQLWRDRYAERPAFVSSALLSVVAHTALIALAVAATNRTIEELREYLEERTTYLHLPPDRTPAQKAVREEMQARSRGAPLTFKTYVDVPAGNTLNVAQQAEAADPLAGLKVANSDFALPEVAPLPGRDSVYSLIEVDSTVVRDPLSAAPAYPEDMRQKGVEGSAFVQYVVDTTGRADMESFKVLRSTHASFAAAVREALPLMRYTPAKIGERRVRQLVEQEFSFKLEQSVTQSAKGKAKPDDGPERPPRP